MRRQAAHEKFQDLKILVCLEVGWKILCKIELFKQISDSPSESSRNREFRRSIFFGGGGFWQMAMVR